MRQSYKYGSSVVREWKRRKRFEVQSGEINHRLMFSQLTKKNSLSNINQMEMYDEDSLPYAGDLESFDRDLHRSEKEDSIASF